MSDGAKIQICNVNIVYTREHSELERPSAAVAVPEQQLGLAVFAWAHGFAKRYMIVRPAVTMRRGGECTL